MRQISKSEFNKLTASAIKALLPFELTSDGEVIGVFDKKEDWGRIQTKCPNCKLTYTVTPPSKEPYFFSIHSQNGV